MDEKILCIIVQKEVNLSSPHHKEEKEFTKLFHIKIQIKKNKVDALFDFSCSQVNLIGEELVSKLGLKLHDHSHPYSLGWVNKNVELKVTKQYKLRFAIIAIFIDEIEVDAVPLDVYIVVFGSPYMYMRDAIFMKKV